MEESRDDGGMYKCSEGERWDEGMKGEGRRDVRRKVEGWWEEGRGMRE